MGEKFMIKKFKVNNFKSFEKELVLDFSKIRDYEFNDYLIKNGLVNKMLIYGDNNTGKSNLGAAIMDITRHLTDNWKNNKIYKHYVNGNNNSKEVFFSYEFLFDKQIILYEYKKDNNASLIIEELYLNNELLFSYNYKNNKVINNIEEAKTIDFGKKINVNMSALKYLYVNTMHWSNNSPIKLFMEFVEHMLWFRSLRDNEFMGLLPDNVNLSDFIIDNGLIKDFEKFLVGCGQEYKLCEIDDGSKTVLGVKYNNYKAKFHEVMSTGTSALWLFYYWMNRLEYISFIFLDEFDAFYHSNLSEYILKYVNSKNNFQSILTTHDVYLADNELMRPDCYFIIGNNKIKAFCDCTTKTIRQGHNLGKMYTGGEFEI